MQSNYFISLLTILVQGTSFIAAFAAVASSVIMYQVVCRFGKGVLADGFKFIMSGLLFVALAIVIDAFANYLGFSNDNPYALFVNLIKGICFMVGTYSIVIGSRKTVDKLEVLAR